MDPSSDAGTATATPPAPPGAVDLMGVLAYGELSAFERLAEDARTAPTLRGRAQLASMAAAEMAHFELIEDYLERHGVSVHDAMGPFTVPLDTYHASTAPASWLESLVKAYVGDGLAADFYTEIAGLLDAGVADTVRAVMAETGHSAFVEHEVGAALEADPRLRGVLTLWARRLLGEAVVQAQHVLAQRDELALLLVNGPMDLTGLAALFRRLQNQHTRRMKTLGLG